MAEYIEKIQIGSGESWPIAAEKFADPRAIQVDLASTSAASFDGSADAAPGVKNILSVPNGGTGGDTPETARTGIGAASIDDVYPVGSIYLTVSTNSPETLFGGTWVQIKDMFLLAAGDTYAAGTTGGEAEHTHTMDSGYAKFGWSWASGTQNYLFASLNSTPDSYPSTSVLGLGGDHGYWDNASDRAFGVDLGGTTDTTANMPPYLAVYVWQRTA